MLKGGGIANPVGVFRRGEFSEGVNFPMGGILSKG